MALVPLTLRGELLGALNQGSVQTGHFSAEKDTELLQHLANVTAMCIDNVLSHEELRRDGFTDSLTKVANRRFFDRRLGDEIDRCRRDGTVLSCMLVDADHFKQINDQHGHRAGDRVLVGIAGCLAAGMRASDVVARYGGEEFVCLLPHTTLAEATALAERLRTAIDGLSFSAEGADKITATVSIGVASLQPERNDGDRAILAESLLEQADAALYGAKDAGRNRIVSAPE